MISLRREQWFGKQEIAIKEALLDALKENIKEVEYEAGYNKKSDFNLCESTGALCTTLEAIFLHGLKDSFLWQTISIIAGDEERRPNPSFWSPILIFLHKGVIEQVQSLTQITSEIGQCRAWVRISLNDNLLSSYLGNISKSSSSLSPYYKKYALLKDTVRLSKVINVLTKFEECCLEIKLPYNSSLLNQWPDAALQLSGLWTPPLKNCPVTSGLDVAGSITSDSNAIPMPQPVRPYELFSESISNSPFQRSSNFPADNLNNRNNIDLLLQAVDEMNTIDEEETNSQKDLVQSPNIELPNEKVSENLLNSLMHKSWCSELNNQQDVADRNMQRSTSVTSTASSLPSLPTDRCSYNSLLRKHQRNREVEWTEIWTKFLTQNSVSTGEIHNDDDSDDCDKSETQKDASFEFISGDVLEKFDIADLQEMVEQLCKLGREPGLDSQGFLCKSCQHPLGIGYSNFRVCAFSGNYFCTGCMDLEPAVIPAKVIYNWDFRKHCISKRAATFLSEFRNQPFIDLKVLNPDIYNASECMAEMQSLRIRLNFIRAYLCTCSTISFEELQRKFFGKEYLYEHIHQYSIGDLLMIQRGSLYQQLHSAFKAGESHILKCSLCKVKGFICEICKSSRILYPFHIETTFRCSKCGSVFHAECLDARQPCPRCKRQQARENLLAEESPT
uniref:RUN domain-containing protein n=1 Tax=Glossina palpalis gambiensis TaxID=67801 RepID=A0A1B0BX73_9MUSC